MGDDRPRLLRRGLTLAGLDPLLADNGGPTKTHALEEGSIVLDQGLCGLTTDQRGVDRDGSCDSGAYELVTCLAPDGPDEVVSDMEILSEVTFEVCREITVGPALTVSGPSGHLILRAGQRVVFENGTTIGVDGRLTVEIDPLLDM